MTASNKTKENIAKAFVALTEQKPINKITVREIAAKSGVTTVTFYNYFLDKYDLAIWLHVKESKKIMAKINGKYEWKNTLLEGLRYFAKNRNFMLNALNHTGGHNGFLRRVERINEELLTAEIKRSLKRKPCPWTFNMQSRSIVQERCAFCLTGLSMECLFPPKTCPGISRKACPSRSTGICFAVKNRDMRKIDVGPIKFSLHFGHCVN